MRAPPAYRLLALLVAAGALLAAGSCTTTPESGATPPPQSAAPAPAEGSDDARFAEVVDRIYTEHLARNPGLAVELGYHEYDGKVPPITKDAIEDERQWLHRSEDELAAFDPARLSSIPRVEREVLLGQLRTSLFHIEELRSPWRNPLIYSLDVSAYISRPYAPAEERAKAVRAVSEQAPAFYAQARANLEDGLPRPWVQIALLQTKGTIDFVKTDVPLALSGELTAEQQGELKAAVELFATALADHAAFLEERLKTASEDYALGEEKFLKMLRVQNGVDVDLATLQAVADQDLERNLKAMEIAARKIDKNASTADVVAQVLADKPAADQVLAEASGQCNDLKQHLEAHALVTIPSADEAFVKETPPFLRYNFAFLDGAGPFEDKPLPSFYYITPPDPSWPKDKQEGYIPGKTDLLGTSIHEVWPGHFLHGLHRKTVKSKVLKSYWNYAMGEGWAHYVEEMMVTDGGYRSDEPAVQVGMLVNALLRNVRFVSAIGLHARGMSMKQSEALFLTKAFQDEGNAQQQATRGTFDPMYLSYTLGKLMIMKLREDYKKQQGDAFSLKDFHDRLLSFGSAPVPVIRREMLGPNAGPAL